MEKIVLYGREYTIPHDVETADGDNRKAVAEYSDQLARELETAAKAAGVKQIEIEIADGVDDQDKPKTKKIPAWPDFAPAIHDKVTAARRAKTEAAPPAAAPNAQPEG